MKKRKSNIISCINGFKIPTILTPVFIICEVVLEIIIPLIMAAIVDGGLYREENFMLKEFFPPELIADRDKFILVLGCIMILASLFSLAFGMLAARTAAVASTGFAKNLRRKIFVKCQEFSFANTDKFSTSSLIMRATTDVNNIQNTFQQMIRMLVRSPIMLIMAATMAININSELSIIFIVALPILILGMLLLVKIGFPRF